MKCALSVCLLLLATVAEYKTDAAPKVAAAKKDAKGYDYDYYNPDFLYYQKRAPHGYDYDYYNYNPYMYQKRLTRYERRPYLRFVKQNKRNQM